MSTNPSELPAQPRQYRKYSDEDKARALALFDLCGNLPEASRKSGIATSTLWQWITGARNKNNKSVPKLRNSLGQSLADQFEEIAIETTRVAVDRLRSRGARSIPYGQLMAGGQIAVNSMQLLRGEPTTIAGVSEADRQLRLAELLERLESRGPAPRVIDVTPEPEE